MLALDEPRAAFLKAARLVFDADEAARVLTARLATLPEQELAGFAIVRSPADIDEQRTTPWAADYMRWVFGREASEQ